MLENPRILFIGGGNMGRALAGGLCRCGWEADRIVVADPDSRSLQRLSDETGLTRLYYENTLAYSESTPDVVLFATKPDKLAITVTELAPWMVTEHPLLITIAAGVRADDLSRWAGGHCPVVRAMPNTPAMIGAGMSVLYARPDVSEAQRELAERILQGVGETLWVEDEALVDAATAVSGSGPAYFFLFMQALVEAAGELGLDEAQARLLVLETAHGAQALAAGSTESLARLCQQVTSPGGTTEAALATLGTEDFRARIRAALAAAHHRAVELGDENGRA